MLLGFSEEGGVNGLEGFLGFLKVFNALSVVFLSQWREGGLRLFNAVGRRVCYGKMERDQIIFKGFLKFSLGELGKKRLFGLGGF